ncbi:Nitric oxide synthase-interacting protein [Phytophthora megakarya]|uniref:Nitric oxide synthase-interacting protein n=1 Tax=Phytophthora megakarya TaxID=4795 RepID=A0A225VMV2_9STRA|nr:Nitric oxide synthase-interacting protein [Phytophthora megakarya]
MSRHSKNATATTHFTYREREAAGHGTLKRRFGRDAQLAFGVCCLCLATTHSRSPLVSPGGFVYCKECIYANLLAQKRSIQENLANYERFVESQDRRTQDELIEKERQTLQKALDAVEGAVVAAGPQDQGKMATQKLMEKVDRATDDDKREAMKKTSFWIPDCTPSQENKVDKPDTKTRDPMSLDEMKLKHLMPVKFEWDSSTEGKHKVLCAVTKKEISHHRAVLLRPSGYGAADHDACPVTGLKLRKKDVVQLQAGGTGFSAHSTVEAKKYRPTMT